MRSTDMASIEVRFREIDTGVPNTREKAETLMLSVPKVSVGIIVHNEERNILSLLQSVSVQELNDLVIDEIIVVSSGSEDKTNKLVLKHGEKDGRVRLVVQDVAEGKTSGINQFLKEGRNEIVVVSSGDVIFNRTTLQNLVCPLIRDETVGMTSARPIPINASRGFMGTVAEIHWRLHHKLERHGETMAFRKSLMNHIPNEVSADEAYVESAVHQRALKTLQVSDSLVFNKGAENVAEFLHQIRRHYAGHLLIKTQESYLVSSMTLDGLAKIAMELLRYLSENPNKTYQIAAYVPLEGLGRLVGIWDFYVRKKQYRVWSAANTTKILNKKSI